MSNILELSHVNKSFEGFSLEDISFALPKGFIMGFIGPNGAGKTTTIKLILKLITADSGIINVFGKDNVANEQDIKERIGIVMDQPFYVNEWNVSDIEMSLSPFYRNWNSRQFKALVEKFSLDPKKKVKEFSKGMSMKLMVAVALSHSADLLIMDEPTSGLDAVARNELMDILKDFNEDENKGVLFSTHITTDLEKIADYITFINDGKILYTGTKDQLMENYYIVKGGADVLSCDQKKYIIGYRRHDMGFDGMCESSAIRYLPKSLIKEPVTLDEIVLRFNLGGKYNE